MKNKLFLLLLIFIIYQSANAQNIPIIHASSELVDIREGEDLYVGSWTIMPEYKPDVYTSNKVGEKITFYTDKDSISYTVDSNEAHDFIIVLNGKDSAYTQIKYEPSYLDKLKMASEFGNEIDVELPKFTYQEMTDPNLVALREGFNLDSIAGTGNEVSQILHLLHWIHDLIPHDGNNNNPTVKNAMSMMSVCKTDNRGLNCRGLSIVLNECYLAMGFKSRYVTCMPRDSIFQDCHVINMVYSNDLEKWIWVDPTHDAYVMDEKGELLGFAEVRERLINDQTIILNPDANWNKKQSTLKEYYIEEYMAKNLYRFSTPLHSRYDFETNEKGKVRTYVELIPLAGINDGEKITEKYYKKSGVTFKTYKTNNPDLFWAKPE